MGKSGPFEAIFAYFSKYRNIKDYQLTIDKLGVNVLSTAIKKMEEDMRFLITGKNKFPLPPEMAEAVLDATIAWAKKYSGNGKIEQLWGLAGMAGGGGIVNVDSPDELDTIMIEFPLGPFTDLEVYPLTDFTATLERTKQAMQAAASGG
jgi:muconolactone delta-isomerase